MRTSRVRHIVSLAVFAVCFSALLSVPAVADEEADLRESFKERLPKLLELKLAGKIGETPSGFVEAVTKEAGEDENVNKMIKAENDDRKAVYAMIAKKTSTTVDEVAKNNALRIFQKADENVLFKGPDGKWVAKKDVEAAGK